MKTDQFFFVNFVCLGVGTFFRLKTIYGDDDWGSVKYMSVMQLNLNLLEKRMI